MSNLAKKRSSGALQTTSASWALADSPLDVPALLDVWCIERQVKVVGGLEFEPAQKNDKAALRFL